MGLFDIFKKENIKEDKNIENAALNDNIEKETIDYEIVSKSFYTIFKEAILKFSKSEDNKQVYAIVFDCDNDNGQVCIRYANEKFFEDFMKNYEKYKSMFEKYGKYNLVAYKYSTGDFKFIDFEEKNEMKHFDDTYYYYITEDKYYGDDKPYEIIVENGKKTNIKNDLNALQNMWERLIIENINKLLKEDLGIDKTDDYIMFMVLHDQSDEDIKKYINKTVDENTFKKVFIENKLVR